MPRSASAWRRSRYDLPVETMPSRACGLSNTSAVEGVGAGERAHRLQLEAVQPLLLGERRVRPADVEAARRQREVVGRTNCDARRVQLDRGRGVDRVVHALQADPAAAVAGQRKAEQADTRAARRRRPGSPPGSWRRPARTRSGARWSRIRRCDRRPSARARRQAARCRRDWRDGRRRRCDRPPAPCRTTCRTRRRSGPRRAARPAACPRARSRRGPR